MVAPIIIKNINQNEIAIAAKANLEFKYINHIIIVERANISIQITSAMGFLRWMVRAFKINTNKPIIYIVIIDMV